jgi:hypothetical protein
MSDFMPAVLTKSLCGNNSIRLTSRQTSCKGRLPRSLGSKIWLVNLDEVANLPRCQDSADICANCGAPRPGEYCAVCGERRVHRQELKLSAFAASALEEITDLQHSRLLNTLRVLTRCPGLLTTEYLRGRRRSYIGPFKIYLATFALSFLLYSIYQPTSVYDVRAFLASDQSGTWRQLVAQLGKKVALPESIVIAQLNEHWQHYVSFSNALYPLGLALILKFVYLPARRFYTEHLIFALHYGSLVTSSPLSFGRPTSSAACVSRPPSSS